MTPYFLRSDRSLVILVWDPQNTSKCVRISLNSRTGESGIVFPKQEKIIIRGFLFVDVVFL